ncbi:MAG: acetamidase/formamidase family protein, partial [Anaerotignaceae bacterium]
MKRKIIGAILVATIALNSIPTFADTSTFTILQTKEDGVINGEYYVNTELDSITWGRLPNKNSQPVLTIPSGSTVTFDTMSHEGLLEDQGRDALAYFSSKGVSADAILQTGIDITSSELTHDFDADGPHIVTGPVYVEGAEPGDVLKVEVLSLAPRVPYGVISNRHYKGALVNEFPELTPRVEGASALEPDKYGNVSVFAPIKKVGESYVGYLEENGKEITFPIDPFLGIMGVAANTDDAW